MSFDHGGRSHACHLPLETPPSAHKVLHLFPRQKLITGLSMLINCAEPVSTSIVMMIRDPGFSSRISSTLRFAQPVVRPLWSNAWTPSASTFACTGHSRPAFGRPQPASHVSGVAVPGPEAEVQSSPQSVSLAQDQFFSRTQPSFRLIGYVAEVIAALERTDIRRPAQVQVSSKVVCFGLVRFRQMCL